MFDWNDEELSNIIWGEDGEVADHIVPYRDANEEKLLSSYGDSIKKEKDQEAVNVKPAERKKVITFTDLCGVKRECCPPYGKNEGVPAREFSVDTWPDLYSPNAAKTDQESTGTEIPDSVTKVSICDIRNDEQNALLENTSGIFESQLEESDPGDFVDYGWATVGSFEDLDKIFSHEDPMFGHGSLGNPDELWASSKDVLSSPEKSIPLSSDSPSLVLDTLRTIPEQFEGQGEYLSDQNQSFHPGCENLNMLVGNVPQEVRSSVANAKYPGSNSKLSIREKTAFKIGGNTPPYKLKFDAGNATVSSEYMDKGNKQKKSTKGRKKSEEKYGAWPLPNLQAWTQTGNQFLHFHGPFISNAGEGSSSLLFNQQEHHQGTDSSQFKHLSSPVLPSFMHGNLSKQCTTTPVLSQFPSGNGSNKLALSNYEVSPSNLNPLNQSTEMPIKSLVMTPQEKIEKLRRRQQLRAMLAIQKQRQQFGNQVSSTEYSVMEGENSEGEENLLARPSLVPNSPVDQNDSNTIYMAGDDCSAQDSILFQLQDIVGKLDLRVRLCIRDSLFRLAQSASQRQHAGDTSSSNKSSRDEVPRKEEINSQKRFCRFPKTSEAETETNPIDRTVAHLVFHRLPEFTGKLVETPDSPLSTKLKASSSISLLTKSSSPRSEKNQILSHEESELPSLYSKLDQYKNRTAPGGSENASTIEDADTRKMKADASQ